jgi:hypothetical protein
MNHYHNTTNESDPAFEKKATSQDYEVLSFLKGYGQATASFIWRQRFTTFTPLTSVRRALTNLEKEGFIEKAGKQKGIYGRNEFIWKVK